MLINVNIYKSLKGQKKGFLSACNETSIVIKSIDIDLWYYFKGNRHL